MTSAENTALADVDQVSEHEWDEVMSSFLDANVYQTWAYGSVRWGEKNLSHLVVRRGSVIIGAAQLRILRVPVLGRGIAYLRWGPMWRGRGHELDPQGFRETVRALRQEYAVKRRLLLRVMPRVFQTAGYAGDVAEALQSEQFVPRADIRSYRTFVLDLSPSLDDLRSSFEKQWRKHLRQAEENGLTLVENGEDRGFHQLIRSTRKCSGESSLSLSWTSVTLPRFSANCRINRNSR